MTVAMTKPVLKIDPEFQAKIPPLSEAEFKQLEENILRDGEVYDPIVIWNGTIVDGHNRYRIIQDHPWLEWRVREMQFADKWEAFDWMCANQLGRRNLTDEQRTYLIGKMYEARKHATGGAQNGNQFASKKHAGENCRHVSRKITKQGTAGEIARELGTGERTVRDAEQYSKGIDAIRIISSNTASDILSGKKKIKKKDIKLIGTAPEPDRPALISAVVEGRPIPKEDPKPKPASALPPPQPAPAPSAIGKPIAAPQEERGGQDVPQTTDFSKINWRSAEGRRVKEQIDQAIRESYSDETPEFTLPMLIEELNLDIRDFTEKLSRMLTDRADIITESIRIETKNLLHNLKKYKEALNNGK